jgi:anti-sigma factor RsiW
MKITRDVITDLLPAYLTGEASADTRALIEEYLEEDREFARIIEHSKEERIKEMLGTNQLILPVSHEVETLSRLRARLRRRLILTAVTASCLVGAGALMFSYQLSQRTGDWTRDAEGLAALICAGGIMYWLYTYLRSPRLQLRDLNLRSPWGWFLIASGLAAASLSLWSRDWKPLIIGALAVMVGIDWMRIEGRVRRR